VHVYTITEKLNINFFSENMSSLLAAVTEINAVVPFQNHVQHKQPRSQHDEHTSVQISTATL